jgi:hypothetical protein
MLYYCEPGRRPSICYGAFRLSADGFIPIRVNHRAPSWLPLNVSVVAEPRLKILSAGPEIITQAKDNRDRSLIHDDKRKDDPIRQDVDILPKFMRSRPYGNVAHAGIGLSRPEKDARTAKVISGSMAVTIEKSRRSVVVSDDIWQARGREVPLGRAKMQITDFIRTPGKDEYKVCMTIDKRSISAGAANQEHASL